MEKNKREFSPKRESVTRLLGSLSGFNRLTLRQQKLCRTALQLREMYPDGKVSLQTEDSLICYGFVDRVETESVLSTVNLNPYQQTERKTAFKFQGEIQYFQGRGNLNEQIRIVKKFGYPLVVNFSPPSLTEGFGPTIAHIAIVLGEKDGEPMVLNKDSSAPFELVPLSSVIAKYEDMFSYKKSWFFGIRKLHCVSGVIEPVTLGGE